jgi:hypothetical protein
MRYKTKENSRLFRYACITALASSVLLFTAGNSGAQEEQRPAARGKINRLPAASELAWPLPPNVDKSFDSIDASKLKHYVEEQSAISDKYRDLDPSNQWWGRISGMPSGAAEQAWVEQKFKDIGLPFETHAIDMGAQDWPKSWSITVTANGKTIKLESANPIIDFTSYMASPQGDEDLDAVWVGLGQASDFIGKDVRGKAVFIYSIASPSSLVQSAQWMGSVARAQRAGAKVVVVDLAIPGNWRYVSHMNGTLREFKASVFTIGDQDGTNVEALNAAASGSDVKAHVTWNVEHYPDLKEGIVVGKLGGMTDENIIMLAHTDGYFEAATDDGAGTAALLGTAEYFAKLPKEQRRRTMYFIATPDHHGGDNGGKWMVQNLASIFPKTAVIVNAEHVAAMDAVWDRAVWGSNDEPVLIPTNSSGPSWWGVYGSDKLARIVRDDYATFGVPTQVAEGGSAGQLSRLQFQAPSFYLHNKGVYYHAENDVPAIVPGNSLRNAVQAFCKIFLDINNVDLKDLQPPASSLPRAEQGH